MALAAALATAGTHAAWAQASGGTALAEELFQQGKRAMNEGHYAEACPKLAESQRLAPGMGTLLSLAVCHEGEGKIASAWAEFNEVLPAARRANRPDRAQYAEQRIAALAPRLSRLKIVVPPDVAQTPGFAVQLNGAAMNNAALGIAAPVDGGTYTVTARATDKQPWSQEVTVKAEKDQQVVTVPLLQARPVAEAAPALPSPTTPVAVAGTSAEPVTALPAESSAHPRWPLYVAVGATAALAAGAAATGVVALGKASDFKDANQNHAFTQEQRQSLRDKATSMGTVSTVLGVGAVAAAATSVYLFVTGPRSSNAQGLRVVPFAGPAVAGIQLVGAR